MLDGFGKLLGNIESDRNNEPVEYSLNQNRKQQVVTSGGILCVFLGIGLLIPGTEKLFPLRIFNPPDATVWMDAGQKGGLDSQALNQFLASDSVVFSGRAINPRFFYFGQSIPRGLSTQEVRQYPRLEFTLVGSQIPVMDVVLPFNKIPEDFQNGAEISVLGCMSDNEQLDAVIIYKAGEILVRDPSVGVLKCPLQPIKCNDNHVCK